jgi:dethiobiotin synthetase
MVTPNRLGTLNTTVMSARMLEAAGLEPRQWILNETQKEDAALIETNVAALAALLKTRHILTAAFDPQTSLENFHIGRPTLDIADRVIKALGV